MLKTTDGGVSWREISPDLTEAQAPQPAAADRRPQSSITSFSISPVRQGVIWAGTNNAVIQRTADDGAAWRDVSPHDIPAHGTFEIVEAGRHDERTAFAAYIVPNDVHPYIYRTRDAGATWSLIVRGLPDDAFARVVREDPVVPGLLYCGTESGVYISTDDGDTWQSLQLNLPASSMRDLAVHGDDLVLATYGRGLWVLDNVTPIRQLASSAPSADLQLLAPAPGVRARWDNNEDTPLPIETPAAPNPREGAVIDYYLAHAITGELTLTVTDERGEVVRRYSSSAKTSPSLPANVPWYWFAPPEVLSRTVGLNRFAWDFRYPAPKILPFGYFGAMLPYIEYTLADHAIPGRTPRDQPQGPLAVPGRYTLELSAGGQRATQTLVVTADPRVTATPADLAAQLTLARRLMGGLSASYDGYTRLADLRVEIADDTKAVGAAKDSTTATTALAVFEKQIEHVQNGTTEAPGLGTVNREMARLFSMVESADVRPTEPLAAAAAAWCGSLDKAYAGWEALKGVELSAANAALAALHRPAIEVPSPPPVTSCPR